MIAAEIKEFFTEINRFMTTFSTFPECYMDSSSASEPPVPTKVEVAEKRSIA